MIWMIIYFFIGILNFLFFSEPQIFTKIFISQKIIIDDLSWRYKTYNLVFGTKLQNLRPVAIIFFEFSCFAWSALCRFRELRKSRLKLKSLFLVIFRRKNACNECKIFQNYIFYIVFYESMLILYNCKILGFLKHFWSF